MLRRLPPDWDEEQARAFLSEVGVHASFEPGATLGGNARADSPPLDCLCFQFQPGKSGKRRDLTSTLYLEVKSTGAAENLVQLLNGVTPPGASEGGSESNVPLVAMLAPFQRTVPVGGKHRRVKQGGGGKGGEGAVREGTYLTDPHFKKFLAKLEETVEVGAAVPRRRHPTWF